VVLNAAEQPTLIVSCTDRKTLHAGELQLRNFIGESNSEDFEGIAKEWASKVREALASEKVMPVSARDLYCGEYWKIAKQAERMATVFVASAGLGLQKMDSNCPGYGATFASNSADSIPNPMGDFAVARSEWWECLRTNRLGYSIDEVKSEVVLVAVSSAYQVALSEDLKELAASGRKVIVMSGSEKISQFNDVENIGHIKTEQWLRMQLKGSTPCVGIRFAEHVIKENKWKSYEEIKAEYEELEKRYENRGSERLPKFDRESMDPEKIKVWIKKEIDSSSKDRRPAKSVLLRKFRDDGNACEQKKFGDLYNQVVVS
jgi:hypothetical protein